MYNLNDLYQGFDDSKFKADIELLETKLKDLQNLSLENSQKALKTAILHLESLKDLTATLFGYCALVVAADTANEKANQYQFQLSQLLANYTKDLTKVEKYFGSLDEIETLIADDEVLSEYKFYFQEAKKDYQYLLADEIEEIISKFSISGGDGWSNMYRYLTSKATIDYQGKTTTLNELRNLAYDQEAEVRKSAYQAELKLTESIADAIAFALNNIKSQVLTTLELRGYESIMDLTLQQNRMQAETLDALLSAMQAYLPKFREFLKQKAKLLGHSDGLPWYDLFAPLTSDQSAKHYSIEQAKNYLIQLFSKFSPDLAEMTQQHFEKDWIDFLPRDGKVGGAFCANLPQLKQSRVLTNYGYQFSDIVTLAHELGHSYHGLHTQDHRPLNRRYTMPVAETASTFNEVLLMHYGLEAASDQEKLILLESSLSDLTQIIVDIYSRYVFEKEVFDRRTQKFMFKEELSEMMLEAQKQAYGDSLQEAGLHPYMWVVKGHYYRPSLSFYNFPYAFGGLFARGLFAQYLEKPEGFVEKYQALLKATTVNSVEDAALKMDIDVRNPEFWHQALELAAQQIDTFIELSKKAD